LKIRFLLHDVYGRGGGVVTVTFALAEELAKRHDVELISTFGGNRSAVHPLPAGVPVTSLIQDEGDDQSRPRRLLRGRASKRPSRIIPTAERRFDQYSRYTDLVLGRYLRSLGDGVLVTMQPALNVAAARLGTAGCVRVAQDHRPFKGRPRNILENYKEYAGGLDTFLTLTKADAVRYRKLIGDQVPVRALGNGTPNYEGPLSTHTNRTVVAAGRLSRTKGFDVLIASWVHVAEQHPDWQLQIWGEGGLRPELTQQITDLGLTSQVQLMGFSNQLQEELAQSSIFVLSSRAEGYPRVILEAMACGVPVVSTDCPSGPREMIESGVDGLLVPTQDAAALGSAINQMIERGPEGRREIGLAGLARARALSQAVVAQRWEKLLSDLSARGEASVKPGS